VFAVCKKKKDPKECGSDTNIEIEGQIRKAQKVYERRKWKPITWGPQTHTH